MKKVFLIFSLIILGTAFVFGQSDDELFGGSDFTSDDELFGGSSSDDDLFGGSDSSDEDLFGSEDEMFLDDGIEEITDTTAKDNLSKGVLFEAGAVKVGGRLRAGLNTNTILYNPEKTDFGENIKNTTLSPTLSALLSVDARPTETLRIYTKFGMEYPFVTNATTQLIGITADGKKVPMGLIPSGMLYPKIPGMPISSPYATATSALTAVSNWLTLKELFTDFSIKDRAFFRFGLHTVSWGTGYFFSPVSDMINTSSIDPENPTEQVNGALNLRTQVVFPGSQNCLWAYIIPSNNFKAGSAEAYARDTGLAAKYDFVIGGWELGTGVYWKYENPLKIMATASGSIKKLSLFGEFVYQYGDETEWAKKKDWEDKTNIFQATIGGFYTWKDPGIMLALQYYYDGNNVDLTNRLYSDGHNIALMANFSKFGNIKNLSASIFGIVNFGRSGFTDDEKKGMSAISNGKEINSLFPCLMINANIIYSPVDNISLSIGPSLTFSDFKEKPTVSLKIGATLGGGKF